MPATTPTSLNRLGLFIWKNDDEMYGGYDSPLGSLEGYCFAPFILLLTVYEIHTLVFGKKRPKSHPKLDAEIHIFVKGEKHPIDFSHFWYDIPLYQIGIKNENIQCMKFIP